MVDRSFVSALIDMRLNENLGTYNTFFNSMNSDNLMLPAVFTSNICLFGNRMVVEHASIDLKTNLQQQI